MLNLTEVISSLSAYGRCSYFNEMRNTRVVPVSVSPLHSCTTHV